MPLKRAKATKDDAMFRAWESSQCLTLCDVVVTQGKKHVATYRDGNTTHYNGKEHKS